MNTRSLLALTALAVAPAFAQLAAPNAAGVAVGHVHINASDVDAQVKFWTEVGGKIVQRDKITMAQFPGMYVLIRKQTPTGPSVGSAINHFGFYVRDLSQPSPNGRPTASTGSRSIILTSVRASSTGPTACALKFTRTKIFRPRWPCITSTSR